MYIILNITLLSYVDIQSCFSLPVSLPNILIISLCLYFVPAFGRRRKFLQQFFYRVPITIQIIVDLPDLNLSTCHGKFVLTIIYTMRIVLIHNG